LTELYIFIKGELGVTECIYFKKILLHQQKILVVYVLTNSPCCRDIWKRCAK